MKNLFAYQDENPCSVIHKYESSSQEHHEAKKLIAHRHGCGLRGGKDLCNNVDSPVMLVTSLSQMTIDGIDTGT